MTQRAADSTGARSSTVAGCDVLVAMQHWPPLGEVARRPAPRAVGTPSHLPRLGMYHEKGAPGSLPPADDDASLLAAEAGPRLATMSTKRLPSGCTDGEPHAQNSRNHDREGKAACEERQNASSRSLQRGLQPRADGNSDPFSAFADTCGDEVLQVGPLLDKIPSMPFMLGNCGPSPANHRQILAEQRCLQNSTGSGREA